MRWEVSYNTNEKSLQKTQQNQVIGFNKNDEDLLSAFSTNENQQVSTMSSQETIFRQFLSKDSSIAYEDSSKFIDPIKWSKCFA